MFGIKEKGRPWQDELPEQPEEQWLDEQPEEMKKLPPKEECIDRIPVNCHNGTLTIWVVGLLGGFSFSWGAHYRMYKDIGWETALWLFAFVVLVGIIDTFLGRKERAYIEIYPQMMVIYWYDKEKKMARLWDYVYWKDVVQYSKGENAIWFESEDDYPFCPQIKMKKLKPYLEQYAPHAKIINFSVQDYMEKKRKKDWKKHNAEYQQQIKGYNEKKKELIEEARKKAQEMREQELREQELKEQEEEEKNNKE